MNETNEGPAEPQSILEPQLSRLKELVGDRAAQEQPSAPTPEPEPDPYTGPVYDVVLRKEHIRLQLLGGPFVVDGRQHFALAHFVFDYPCPHEGCTAGLRIAGAMGPRAAAFIEAVMHGAAVLNGCSACSTRHMVSKAVTVNALQGAVSRVLQANQGPNRHQRRAMGKGRWL